MKIRVQGAYRVRKYACTVLQWFILKSSIFIIIVCLDMRLWTSESARTGREKGYDAGGGDAVLQISRNIDGSEALYDGC